ncbi:hypothetical protein EJB05_51550, partial [Eragrostis curvula]
MTNSSSEAKAKINKSRKSLLPPPPPPDILKVNIDRFIEEKKIGAWGFIVRDHDGGAVLAGAGKLFAVQDALCAEPQAGLAALQAAAASGMSRIQLETDSSCLGTALNTDLFDQAPGGVFFKEMKELSIISLSRCP